MNTIFIKLNDYITCKKGVTPSEGEPIYNHIVASLKKGDNVILDFSNVEMMTTAFLNVVIGNLYKDYTSEQLKSMLSFENLSESIAFRIKKVTDNAKLFYSNEDRFNQDIEEAINGGK